MEFSGEITKISIYKCHNLSSEAGCICKSKNAVNDQSVSCEVQGAFV